MQFPEFGSSLKTSVRSKQKQCTFIEVLNHHFQQNLEKDLDEANVMVSMFCRQIFGLFLTGNSPIPITTSMFYKQVKMQLCGR